MRNVFVTLAATFTVLAVSAAPASAVVGGQQSDKTVYRPGSGVTLPRVLHEVKPQYTEEAKRAGIQGTVLIECVVATDGSVTDPKVTRSLVNRQRSRFWPRRWKALISRL